MECLDQTACAGVVLSGSALFSQTCLRPVGDRAYGSISSVLVCHLPVCSSTSVSLFPLLNMMFCHMSPSLWETTQVIV